MASTDLSELKLKLTTDGVTQATDELESLGNTAKNAEAKIEGLSKHARSNVAPMKNMRAQAQQVSYQLQDMAVQAQMGTSAFTIIGQQGSQLASVFGPAGAVTGALIAFGAIIGGFLWDSMNKSGDAAEDLAARMETLADRFDNATRAQKSFLRAEAAKTISENKEEIKSLNEEIAKLNNNKFDLSEIFSGDLTYQERVDKTNELLAKIDELNIANKETAESVDGTSDETAAYILKLTEQADVLGFTAKQLAQYKINQLGATGADADAIHEKSRLIFLYEKEQEALKEAARQKTKDEAEAKRLDAAKVRSAAKDKTEADRKAKQLVTDKANAENRLLQIAQAGMKEAELLKSITDEKGKVLADDYTKGLIDEEQFLIASQQLNEKYSRDGIALAAAEAQAKSDIQQQVLSSLGGIAGQMSEIAAEGSKEAKALFAIQKAIAIAQIIVSTEVAAQAAGAQAAILAGPLGYFATAAGIRAVGYASAGLVAGTAIAGGRALGGQVRGGESYLVGERGPELLTMGTSGRIATNENLKKAVGSQGETVQQNVSVNFSIQANDTAGFDRLLNSRRGQIISMINQAVNDRGRASLA
jgi:hypothetical protein